jgi:hypothetical protein
MVEPGSPLARGFIDTQSCQAIPKVIRSDAGFLDRFAATSLTTPGWQSY